MKTKSIALLAVVLALATACSRKPETPTAGAPTPAPTAAPTPVPVLPHPAFYVYNSTKKTVSCYDGSGAAVKGFTPASGFKGDVSALAVNPATNTLYVSGPYGTGIRTFDAATGAPKSLGFDKVTEVANPMSLALANGTLYVADNGEGTVRAYDANTAKPVTAGFQAPTGQFGISVVALRGKTLYVNVGVDSEGKKHTVHAFDLATAAPVPGFAMTDDLGSIGCLSVSGNHLIVMAEGPTYAVGEYDATTGAPVHANLGNYAYGMFDAQGDTLYILKGSGDIDAYAFPLVLSPEGELTPSKPKVVKGLDNCIFFVAVP